MYCFDCKKLINNIIYYKNIFEIRKDHICENCFSKLLMIQKHIVIPIEKYVINLNILFDDFNDPKSLMSFLKPYYLYYLKLIKNEMFMYFDVFDNEVYDIIKKLNMTNLFVIVLKNEFEEER